MSERNIVKKPKIEPEIGPREIAVTIVKSIIGSIFGNGAIWTLKNATETMLADRINIEGAALFKNGKIFVGKFIF